MDTEPRDLDLMAYADGLLAEEPQLAARVEAYLDENPAAAARVREHIRQNEAIRQAYGHAGGAEVPHRLLSVVMEPGRTEGRRRRARSLAASFAAVVAAGVFGWWVGRDGGGEDINGFVDYAGKAFMEREAIGNGQAAAIEAKPLSWLSERVSFQLSAPDLRGIGAVLVDRRFAKEGDRSVVELEYLTSSGEPFSLFLRTRWQVREPEIHLVDGEERVTAYWRDGPLAYALVGSFDRNSMLELAEDVRAGSVLDPQIETGNSPQVTVQGGIGTGCGGLSTGACPSGLPSESDSAGTAPVQPVTAN